MNNPKKVIIPVVLFFSINAVLFYVFAFSIKNSQEYDCVLQTARQSWAVVRAVGEPVEPGFFAWTAYYESSGARVESSFSTAVSGPRGKGKLRAQTYRTPADSAMLIELEMDDQTISVYEGTYNCAGSDGA